MTSFLDRSSYASPVSYCSLHERHHHTVDNNVDVQPETVDLLRQTLPRGSAIRHGREGEAPKAPPNQHRRSQSFSSDPDVRDSIVAPSAGPQSEQRLLCEKDPEHAVYFCGRCTCRQDLQSIHYRTRSDHAPQLRSRGSDCLLDQDDNTSGSLYFNYAQFTAGRGAKANSASSHTAKTSSTLYESANLLSSSRDNDIESLKVASKTGTCCSGYSTKSAAKNCHLSLSSLSASNVQAGYSCLPPVKPVDRTGRVLKRVLFILCIFAGLLMSVLGAILGFAVLVPWNSKRVLPEHEIVTSNTTSQQIVESAQKYITVSPSLPFPEKDSLGWAFLREGSAHGSKYTIIDRMNTFTGAQGECRNVGGHLAHVNTIREQVFLEDFVEQELRTTELARSGVGLWLGARRARGSHDGSCMFDQWRWVDAHNRQMGVIRGFAAFMPKKPDNHYNPEECLFMNYIGGFGVEEYLKWDDAPCDIQSVGGIKILCEVELSI